MSKPDRARTLGGATCISGVAALNTLQTSIQKNRARIVTMCQLQLKDQQA